MATRFLVPFSSSRGVTNVDPFVELHREMNRLFDDVVRGSGWGGGTQGGFTALPRLDMLEKDNEICVEADLPGVKASDVDLQIDDDVLTIRGETGTDDEREQQNYHVMERSRGHFLRRVQLPYRPDPQQVKANFENGVLSVHIPKQLEQQRSRRIEVQSHDGGGQRTIEAQSGGARTSRPSAAQGTGNRPSGEGGSGASGSPAGQGGSSGQGAQSDAGKPGSLANQSGPGGQTVQSGGSSTQSGSSAPGRS